MKAKHYTREFFVDQQTGSMATAATVVPLVLEIVPASSVIDVGCGVGGWVKEFLSQGVREAWGTDGDYVDRSLLQIPEERFIPHDLTDNWQYDKEYELATCFEVGEHLPEASADNLVQTLTRLAPVVVFSAAVPGQEGVNHINEQWQDYWRDKFDKKGYMAIDCLRGRLWNMPGVQWWYAQNVIIYASSSAIKRYPRLAEALGSQGMFPISVVHPKYLQRTKYQMVNKINIMQANHLSKLLRPIARRIASRKATPLHEDPGSLTGFSN